MPSIGTFKAQPITRTYTLTGASASYYSDAAITAWIASQGLTAVGSLVTIADASYNTALGNLAATSTFSGVRSLRDMGAEYVIGNEINSRLLVLRRVQAEQNSAVGGLGGTVGYVVVENHSIQNTNARFNVLVARA